MSEESQHLLLPVTEFGVHKRATLQDVLKAGHCSMGRGAYIEFGRDGSGSFQANTWTSQTAFGDVWHQTCKVILKDAGRNHMWLQWDGDEIPPIVAPGQLGPTWTRTFQYHAWNFDLLDVVEWWGKC
jgi:hypothetical protein